MVTFKRIQLWGAGLPLNVLQHSPMILDRAIACLFLHLRPPRLSTAGKFAQRVAGLQKNIFLIISPSLAAKLSLFSLFISFLSLQFRVVI